MAIMGMPKTSVGSGGSSEIFYVVGYKNNGYAYWTVDNEANYTWMAYSTAATMVDDENIKIESTGGSAGGVKITNKKACTCTKLETGAETSVSANTVVTLTWGGDTGLPRLYKF